MFSLKKIEFDKPRRKLSPPPTYADLASQKSSLTSVKSWDADAKDYVSQIYVKCISQAKS